MVRRTRGQRPRAPAPIAIPAPGDDGDDGDIVTADGAARLFHTSVKWIEKARKHYGLPFIRLGPRYIRYSKRAMRAWAAANTGSAA